MPTFQLTGAAAVTIPASALAIRVHVPAGAATAPPSIVAVRDGRIITTTEIRRPSSGGIQLIVEAPTASLTLRLRPEGGAHFPAGVLVDLSLSAEFTRNPDPYRVVVSRVDLSGLPWYDVVELSPASSTLAVRRLDSTDDPLHGIAKEAHDAARSVLRRDALEPERQVDLRVVVDGSASMLRWAGGGLLGEVLQVIGGIDHVIGHDHVLDIRLSSDRQWRRVSADDASAVVTDILEGPRRGEVLETWPASTERTATVVVTDMTPPGWSPGPRDCCVVLCSSETEPLLADGPKVVAVSQEWEGSDRNMDQSDIAALVAGVLQSVLPADGREGWAS